MYASADEEEQEEELIPWSVNVRDDAEHARKEKIARKEYARRESIHLEPLLRAKFLRDPIVATDLSSAVSAVRLLYSDDECDEEDVIELLCEHMHDIYKEYRLAALKRRCTFLLCLQQSAVYKDIRLLLVEYLVRTEAHVERVDAMLSFCHRHFVHPMYKGAFMLRSRVVALLAAAQARGAWKRKR